MSLEAIAALIGHKSLSMSCVYARIADRTVDDEYFAVREMHRRMLGNGYCARPVEMDCHVEPIRESCTFFVTAIDFRPTPACFDAERRDFSGDPYDRRQQIQHGYQGRRHRTGRHVYCPDRHC